MRKIAVIGGRDFTDYALLSKTLDRIRKEEPEVLIISGGARGADSLAQKYAKENGLAILIFYPDYQRYGKRAPLVRNNKIAKECDLLIAFPTSKSRGTWCTVKKAKELGKKVIVIRGN